MTKTPKTKLPENAPKRDRSIHEMFGFEEKFRGHVHLVNPVATSSAADVDIEAASAAPLTDKQAIEQLHSYLGTTTAEELVSLVKTLNEDLAPVEAKKMDRLCRPISRSSNAFQMDPVAIQQAANRLVALDATTLPEAIEPLLANQEAIEARLVSSYEDQQNNLRLVIKKYREVPVDTPVTKEDAELFAEVWNWFGSGEWSSGVPCVKVGGEMANHPKNFAEIQSWLDQLECEQHPSYLRIRGSEAVKPESKAEAASGLADAIKSVLGRVLG
jgi:hypothetical protein